MTKTLHEIMPERGIQRKIADHCKVTQQAVSLWFVNGFVPAKKVAEVSKLTNIKPSLLNPDVFKNED